jgi:hypothetical protein
MKRTHILIALGAFVLPILLRGLWFYRGFYRPQEVEIPEFEGLQVPTPMGASTTSHDAEANTSPGRLVLIDFAHDNLFQIPELESLMRSLSARAASVQIIRSSFESGAPSIEEQLKYTDAYVIIAPQNAYSKDLIAAVEDFVGRGGRLLVISDPTRRSEFLGSSDFSGLFSFGIGGVSAANSILAPFDLAFNDDYLYNLLEHEGNYRNVIFRNFNEDPLTDAISALAFYGVLSVRTEAGKPLIVGDNDTLSSQRDQNGKLIAAALSPDKNVLAIGDMSFLAPPYDRVADNEAFIERLVDFLLGGDSTRDLRSFPYVFRQPVGVLRTEIFDLDADTLTTLADLETSFELQDLSLAVIDEPQEDLDLLALGTYEKSSSEEILPFLESFPDLILPSFSSNNTLTIPGLGEVQPSGIGLMLLTQEEGQTTLLLLADTSEGVFTLSDRLVDGDLFGCLVRETIAVCKVGAAGEFDSFDFDFGNGDFEFDESLLEDFPSPDEPTPTPAPELPPTVVPTPTPS